MILNPSRLTSGLIPSRTAADPGSSWPRKQALAPLILAFKLFFLLALETVPVPARAAFSNYNSILIGERAAGLGGAFTALTGDPAASPYYNPATTVLLKGSSLSATVNVYNKYETDFGEDTDFLEAPQRVNRGFFRSLPSSSGTILNFGSFAAGLTILVPDYDYYSGQLKGADNTNSFLSYVDESLWVGGTFSVKLTSRDSIGVSVYYTARNLFRSASDREITGGGSGAVITSEEKSLTTNSILAIFGFHRQLSPSWSIGMSYRPPSLPISGEGSYSKSTTITAPYSQTLVNRGSLRAHTKIPSRLGIGVAREIPNKSAVSLDIHFYEGQSYLDLPEFPEGADHVEHRHLSNIALGYEQYIRDWVRLRLGFYTNLSSHREPDRAKSVRQGDHIDMGGFSANMNFRTQEQTSFTFGGYYTSGRGHSTQIVGQEIEVIQKSQQVFTMLIATSFNF